MKRVIGFMTTAIDGDSNWELSSSLDPGKLSLYHQIKGPSIDGINSSETAANFRENRIPYWHLQLTLWRVRDRGLFLRRDLRHPETTQDQKHTHNKCITFPQSGCEEEGGTG